MVRNIAGKRTFLSDADRALPWLIAILLAGFGLLRFVYLKADFPTGFPLALGVKGMLYTDEGWWSRNAVTWVREGHWYLDDGYNPMVNLPVLPLLQMVWFKLFGISLATARALTATATVAVSGLVYAFARREISPKWAWLAPFLVVSNYAIFAFSRLALLEMPMLLLMLISLWLASLGSRSSISTVLCSAAVFVGAALTKTTALFALPLLVLVVYRQPKSLQTKIRHALMWLLCFGLLYCSYHVFFVQAKAESYEYFSSYNLSGKLIHKTLLSYVDGPARALRRSFQLFPVLFPCLLVSIVLLAKHAVYRRSFLFMVALLWLGLSMVAFSASNYAPPRYFVVLIVPMALAIPLAMQLLFSSDFAAGRAAYGVVSPRRLDRSPSDRHSPSDCYIPSDRYRQNSVWKAWLMGVAVAGAIALSLVRTALYLQNPDFSFNNMAKAVSAHVASHSHTSTVVMGAFADSLALAAPIKAINDDMGFRSLSHRLEVFDPGYYLFVGPIQEAGTIQDFDYEAPRVLPEHYALEPIDTFDVFQNRIYPEPVFLYRLTAKSK
ncbi:MAG: glycosyltransferase family 39 protein [Cyanobacteria bacterium J06626_6]